MELKGKLKKLSDGRWCIRLYEYNNVGFFIHPYEENRDDLIENKLYHFQLNPHNNEKEYCAYGLNEIK